MEKLYFVIFIISFFLFLLTSFGGFFDSDMDSDLAELSLFSFFSLKDLLVFLTVFSLTNYSLLHIGKSQLLSAVCGVLLGLCIAVTTRKFLSRLFKVIQHKGHEYGDFKGLIGLVTVKIGGEERREGKVSLNVNGSMSEFIAVTNDELPLMKQDKIYVIRRLNNGRLLVTKYVDI